MNTYIFIKYCQLLCNHRNLDCYDCLIFFHGSPAGYWQEVDADGSGEVDTGTKSSADRDSSKKWREPGIATIAPSVVVCVSFILDMSWICLES